MVVSVHVCIDMEKVNKFKSVKLNLSKDELKHLKGNGFNHNWIVGCSCEFYNGAKSTVNDNTVMSCSCVCLY